jgi:L-ascorbate metabolism protein UlaG (beta-lactamase superfamily)
MEIKFHGQSCFELSDGGTTVLTDPFLKPNNPAAVHSGEEVEPTHIALSHGHADHMADAVPVAKRTGAHCVAMVELAEWLKGQGYIGLVPAWHSNTLPGSEDAPFSSEHGIVIGPASGLVIKLGETTVYHAGDTCLFSDMQLVPRLHGDIDVLLLPIGGHYTMDRHAAVIAAEFVGAKTVIPMQYDTFPPIETDAEAFKADVEATTSSRVAVLKPGEMHSV